MNIVGGFLSLAVLALITWGVVSVVRRGGGLGQRSGTPGGVQHFFQLAVSVAAVIMVCSGTISLLSELIRRATTSLVTEPATLALPLAVTIVGAPLLVVMAVWLRRAAATDPTLADSTMGSTFMALASLVLAISFTTSAADALSWAFGVQTGRDWGVVVAAGVWGGAWFGMRRVEEHYIPERRRAVHHALGSLVTGTVAVVGAVTALTGALQYLVAGSILVGQREDTLLRGLAIMLAATPGWYVYWFTSLRRAAGSAPWEMYVLIAGVGGGLVMAVTAASVSLYRVLVWLLGDHPTVTSRQYFSALPESVSVVLVGLVVWAYHRQLIAPGARRTEVNRIYDYILAATGLITGSVGLTMMVTAALEAAVRNSVLVSRSPVNTLLAAATMIAVGSPVWSFTWRRLKSLPSATEQASPTRRIYLYALFGIGGIAALVSLVAFAYQLFSDMLANGASLRTLGDARYSVGILVSTALVAGFHWRVYRGERDVIVHIGRETKAVTLIGPADEAIVREVAHRTGARVHLWVSRDGQGPAWSPEDVTRLVEQTSGSDIVIVQEPAGTVVIPVDR